MGGREVDSVGFQRKPALGVAAETLSQRMSVTGCHENLMPRRTRQYFHCLKENRDFDQRIEVASKRASNGNGSY